MRISLEHKSSALIFLFGKLLRTVMAGVFIVVLLDRTKFLAGYTIQETLLFYMTYNIVDSITQLLYREVYRFRPLILSGDFDTILVKPVHPFVRVLIGGVDVLDIIPTVLYIAAAGYLLAIIPGIEAVNLIWYTLLILNGIFIATAFHILVLALGIISTEVDHTIMIYRDITRFASFPIDIYSEPLRSIITFVLPVGIMMAFPVKSVLGILAPEFIFISFAVALLFMLFSIMMWQLALAKYQSASS